MKDFLAKYKRLLLVGFLLLFMLVSCDKDAFRHLSNATQFFRLGMYEQAIVELKNTSRILRNDEYFQSTYYRDVLYGIVALKEGDNKVALMSFENALKKDISLIQIRYILSTLYLQNERYQKAIALFDGYEEYGGKEYVQGIRYYYQGNYKKSASSFSRLLIRLEDELVYFGEVANGEDIAMMIVKETVYGLLARSFFDINDLDNAIIYYSKVLDENPNDYFAQVNLKISLLKRNLGDPETHYLSWAAIAYQYSLLELYPQTSYYYKKTLGMHSDYLPALIGIAAVYESIGDLKQADFYYKRASNFSKDPQQRSELYVSLARIAADLGDINSALTWVGKALRLSPKDEVAFSNQKQLSLLSKYQEGKASAVEKLLLAQSYKDQKDYYSALKYALDGLRGGDSLEANLQIADIYYKLGRYERAKDYYRKVLAQDANNTQAFSGLALVYVKNDNYVTAIDYMRLALAKNKKDLLLRHRLAQIYFEAGINSEAVVQWRYVRRYTKNKDLIAMLDRVIEIIS